MLLAGYLLSNHAILTGLDFENYHWSYVFAPFGEILHARPGRVGARSVCGFAVEARCSGRCRWPLPRLPWPGGPSRPCTIGIPSRRTAAPRARAAARGPGGAQRRTSRWPGLRRRISRCCSRGQGSSITTTIPGTPRRSRAEVGLRIRPRRLALGWTLRGSAGGRGARTPSARNGRSRSGSRDFQSVLDGEADGLLRRFHVGALLLPADAPTPERGRPLAARGEGAEVVPLAEGRGASLTVAVSQAAALRPRSAATGRRAGDRARRSARSARGAAARPASAPGRA